MKKIQIRFAMLIPLFICLWPYQAYSQNASVDRTDIKIGSDQDAGKVEQKPVTISISEINKWNSLIPQSVIFDKRFSPYELQVYHLEGQLVSYKCDVDLKGVVQDYELVIQNDSKDSIVVRIPNPKFVNSQSPFLSQITAVREGFDSKYYPTQTMSSGYYRILRIDGPAFINSVQTKDGIKHQVEIAPALKIIYSHRPLPDPDKERH